MKSIELVEQIESYRVQPGQLSLWALGGMGFALKTQEAILYIDPYLSASPKEFPIHRRFDPPVFPSEIRLLDAVLCTHEHLDHCDSLTIIPICEQTGALVIGSTAAIQNALEWGIDKEKAVPLYPNRVFVVGDVKITSRAGNDPASKEPRMLILETPAGTIIHAGDSRYTNEFAEIRRWKTIHIAILAIAANPIDEQWYMTPEEACRAARDLGCQVMIPGHWDIWEEYYLDPKQIERAAKQIIPGVRLVVLAAGEGFVYAV